jgi:hypothetical protein
VQTEIRSRSLKDAAVKLQIFMLCILRMILLIFFILFIILRRLEIPASSRWFSAEGISAQLAKSGGSKFTELHREGNSAEDFTFSKHFQS